MKQLLLFGDSFNVKFSNGTCKNGKTCSCCGKYKSLRMFSADSRRKDGLRSSCKLCDKKSQHKSRINIVYEDVPEFKQCSDCGKIKTIAEFGLDKTKKDRHRSYYLECMRDRSKKRIVTGRTRTRKNNI